MMICAKFDWNMPCDFVLEDSKMYSILFFAILQLFPLVEGCDSSFGQIYKPIHFTQGFLYKFEFSLPKDAFCQV